MLQDSKGGVRMKDTNMRTIISELNKKIVTDLVTTWGKDNVPILTLTVPEVAELVRMNNTKVYELVKAGKMPHIRYGRRIVIPITTLVEWLDKTAWENLAQPA